MSDTINYPLSAAIELCEQLDKETPEADKAERMAHSQEYMVPTDFARRLERERDEARQKYNNLATEHMLEVNKICNERDDLMSQDYRTEARAMRYCQERDEARAGREAYKQLAVKHAQDRNEAAEDQKNSRQSLAFALEELEEARNEIHGWKNKWECAVDMAARAEIDRDDILNKLKYIMDLLK